MSLEIKYDVPIQVTREQYIAICKDLGGTMAHRKDDEGRYWIKLWDMHFKPYLQKILEQ